MGKRGEVRGLSPAVMEDAEVKGAISSGKLDAAAVASAVKNAVSPARALTGAPAGGIVGAEAAQTDAQGSSGFHGGGRASGSFSGGGRESGSFSGGGRQKDTGTAAAEYIEKSIDQIVLGNWTDESTLLGTLGQIGLGLLDLDLPMDIRDLAYDLTHWEWSPGHLQQTLMDLVGLLPVIGSLKYADEARTLAKNISRTDEVLDFAGDAGRYLDDILDTAGDAGRYGNELAAAAEDAGKYADDTLETAEDLGRQTDEIANVTQDAGKEIYETADAAEGAGKLPKAEDIIFGSEAKSSQKLQRQMDARGWTNDSVKGTVSDYYTTRKATNRATGNSATVYYSKDGSHVIIDDITNEVV